MYLGTGKKSMSI
jgi:hypothetical protein